MDAIPKTNARKTKHVVGFTRNPSSRECIARETDKFYYNKVTTYSRQNTFDYMSMDVGQATIDECPPDANSRRDESQIFDSRHRGIEAGNIDCAQN